MFQTLPVVASCRMGPLQIAQSHCNQIFPCPDLSHLSSAAIHTEPKLQTTIHSSAAHVTDVWCYISSKWSTRWGAVTFLHIALLLLLLQLLFRLVIAVSSTHLEVKPQFWSMTSFITEPEAQNVFLQPYFHIFVSFLALETCMLVAFPRGKLRHAKVRADFWPMPSFKTVSGKNWASFTPLTHRSSPVFGP